MLSVAHSHHCARSSSTRLAATQRVITTPVETTIATSTAERTGEDVSVMFASSIAAAPVPTIT
jgi:hypothetical protein